MNIAQRTSLPTHLVSSTTIHQCKWHSTVSTVANKGTRISPHLVEGIYGNTDQGGLGDLIEPVSVKELNQVNISEDEMAIS